MPKDPTPRNKYRKQLRNTTSKKKASLLRVKKRLQAMVDESVTLKKIAITVKYHNLIPKPAKKK